MRTPATATAIALSVLACAAPAHAQVVVDPDSPSAKEYAIPLEDARRQADPDVGSGGAGAPEGERASPLFGSGIVPERRERAAKRGEAVAGGGSSSSDERTDETGVPDGTGDPPGPAGAAEVVRAAASTPGTPDGGLSTPLTIAGAALVVLVAGTGAGLMLRRRRF